MKRIIAAMVMVLAAGVCFGQQRLVVPPFQNRNSGIDASQMETLTDLLINAIQRTNRFEVPDRDALALLTAEAKFQMSDWSDDKKTVEMGRVLNANYIVRGIVSKIDTNVYLLIARLLDVNTAQILDSDELEFTTVREARSKMDSFARECFDNIRTQRETVQQQQQQVRQAAEIERRDKTGDTGPAGGIIFYDKGFYSDGWRYLEAAPAGAEFTAAWGAKGRSVKGTTTGVGSGKKKYGNNC